MTNITAKSWLRHGLTICYLFSGLTSLAYEVLWARMLSLQLGVSNFAVVITVAAFMGGLGLGSLLGLRLLRYRLHPLIIFACLEAGIAVYALLLPDMLHVLDSSLPAQIVQAPLVEWWAFQGVALLIIMLLPAIAMGMGFPLILRASSEMGLSLARLYGVNACGGAIGALLPLLLLPWLGWIVAVRLVAVIGLLVALLAWLLSRFSFVTDAETPASQSATAMSRHLSSWLAYAGIGAAALMLQIGWTRLYGMLMLRTEYVLAIILAVFLAGIGAGSLLARYLQHNRWLSLLPCLAAVSAILTLWTLAPLAAWLERHVFASLWSALWWQGMVLMLLTLPVTLILGAWLPLLAQRLAAANHLTAVQGARLYGINSLGAGIGAIIGGFILVPWLGTPQMILLASLLLFSCGIIWSPSRYISAFIVVLLMLAWPVKDFIPVSRLLPQAQAGSVDLFRYEDAVSLTHVIAQPDGQRLLLSDLQRMDASTEATAVASQKNQARLPLLLHESPRNVLLLGLGTGITAAGTEAFPQLQRTAVELSRGAIMAASDWFKLSNERVVDKINIINHDGRLFLRSTTQLFDVIIGDVFHPDMVGRSALLSVEQFARARQRLTHNGWFVQWLALNQFDVESLQVILRSFKQVFPQAILFLDGFRLALAGPNGEVNAAQNLLTSLASLSPQQRQQVSGGEGGWTWLGRYWGPIADSAGVVQSEWYPRIEFSLPLARFRGDIDLTHLLDWLLQQRPLPAQAAEQLGLTSYSMDKADYNQFERAYMASELALRSWLAGLQGNTPEANRLLRFAYQANPADRWTAITLADQMYASLDLARQQGRSITASLMAILTVYPEHESAIRDLWHDYRQSGDSQRAAQYRRQLQRISPLDSELQAQVNE